MSWSLGSAHHEYVGIVRTIGMHCSALSHTIENLLCTPEVLARGLGGVWFYHLQHTRESSDSIVMVQRGGRRVRAHLWATSKGHPYQGHRDLGESRHQWTTDLVRWRFQVCFSLVQMTFLNLFIHSGLICYWQQSLDCYHCVQGYSRASNVVNLSEHPSYAFDPCRSFESIFNAHLLDCWL